VVTYSCDDADSCSYRNSLVHLGALGPVARMRLRVVSDYRMQVYAFRGKCLPYILQHYLELAASCHSFTLGLNFATGDCTTWLRYKIQTSIASKSDDCLCGIVPSYASMLGCALEDEIPFYELGPDVPGGSSCFFFFFEVSNSDSPTKIFLCPILICDLFFHSENYKNCCLA
jgi:hypothetical protein